MDSKAVLWLVLAAISPILFPGLACACQHDSGFESQAPVEEGGG